MFNTIQSDEGFTLVELMVVVAIIGILAAIAIPNLMQYRLKARTSEATANLGGIRSTEVAFFAEWSHYIGNQAATPVVNRAFNPAKAIWIPDTRFSLIGFAPEGATFYSYELVGSQLPAGTATDGLTMNAVGDLDADGVVSTIYQTNFANEIIKLPAGGHVF